MPLARESGDRGVKEERRRREGEGQWSVSVIVTQWVFHLLLLSKYYNHSAQVLLVLSLATLVAPTSTKSCSSSLRGSGADFTYLPIMRCNYSRGGVRGEMRGEVTSVFQHTVQGPATVKLQYDTI